MKPDHERIWLQPEAGDCGETTWCQDRVHDDDIEYVRKDIHDAALIAARDAGLEDAISRVRDWRDLDGSTGEEWDNGYSEAISDAIAAIRAKAQEAAKEGG